MATQKWTSGERLCTCFFIGGLCLTPIALLACAHFPDIGLPAIRLGDADVYGFFVPGSFLVLWIIDLIGEWRGQKNAKCSELVPGEYSEAVDGTRVLSFGRFFKSCFLTMMLVVPVLYAFLGSRRTKESPDWLFIALLIVGMIIIWFGLLWEDHLWLNKVQIRRDSEKRAQLEASARGAD